MICRVCDQLCRGFRRSIDDQPTSDSRSTGDAVCALKLADRAVILDTGQIIFDGSAQDVLDNEALRAEYLAI